MVDRDHHRGDDLDQVVTVSIFPHDLALFDAATGERLSDTVLNSQPQRLPR